MKPLKRISLAFSSMTLALLAGCVNPMSTGTTSNSPPPASSAPTDILAAARAALRLWLWGDADAGLARSRAGWRSPGTAR